MGRRRKVVAEAIKIVELECKRKSDNAWYDCEVSIRCNGSQQNVLNIEFAEFEYDDNENIHSEGEAMARLRARSSILDKGQCLQIQDGDMVLASQIAHSGKPQFYDALVEKVHRQRHSARVSCKCCFDVTWLDGDMKRNTFTVPARYIRRLVQYRIWDHPVILDWLKSVKPTDAYLPSLHAQQSPPGSEMESDIQAELEEEIEKITKMADSFGRSNIVDASQDTSVTICQDGRIKDMVRSKPNARKIGNMLHASPVLSSCKRDQPSVVPVSENGQVEADMMVPLSPNKKPRLSPLAACAALAATVQELPLEDPLPGLVTGSLLASVHDPKFQSIASVSEGQLNRMHPEYSQDGGDTRSVGAHANDLKSVERSQQNRKLCKNRRKPLSIVSSHNSAEGRVAVKQLKQTVDMIPIDRYCYLSDVMAATQCNEHDKYLVDGENLVIKEDELVHSSRHKPGRNKGNSKRKGKGSSALDSVGSAYFITETSANQQLAGETALPQEKHRAMTKASVSADKSPSEIFLHSERGIDLTGEKHNPPCRNASKERKCKKAASSHIPRFSARLRNNTNHAFCNVETMVPAEDEKLKVDSGSQHIVEEKQDARGNIKHNKKQQRRHNLAGTEKAVKAGNDLTSAPQTRDVSDVATDNRDAKVILKDNQSNSVLPPPVINVTVELLTNIHDNAHGLKDQIPFIHKLKVRARKVSFDELPVGFGLGISGWPPAKEEMQSLSSTPVLAQSGSKNCTEFYGGTIHDGNKVLPEGQESKMGRRRDIDTNCRTIYSSQFSVDHSGYSFDACHSQTEGVVLETEIVNSSVAEQSYPQELEVADTDGHILVKQEVLHGSGSEVRKKVTFASMLVQPSTGIRVENIILRENPPSVEGHNMNSSGAVIILNTSLKQNDHQVASEEAHMPVKNPIDDVSNKGSLRHNKTLLGNSEDEDALGGAPEKRLRRNTRSLSASQHSQRLEIQSPKGKQGREDKNVGGKKRKGSYRLSSLTLSASRKSCRK
eukprot:c23074_g1_i1 orf=153-3158(+)